MSWFEIIKGGLQLVLALVDWARDRRQFTAGQDAQIARASLAILAKTHAGKLIMEKLNAMDDGDLDRLVDDLAG